MYMEGNYFLILLIIVSFLFVSGDGDDRGETHVSLSQHVQPAQSFMTSCVCEAVLSIIHLLDDLEVNPDGVAGAKNYTLYPATVLSLSS